jgi:hypothetical protein
LHGCERPVDGTPIDRANTLDRASKRPWNIDPVFPDLVLVLRDPDNPKRGIVICIEAQRKSDPDKRWQISLYQALLAAEHQLDVQVVVVSFSRAFSRLVRSWAHSSPKIDALILDADTVPVMTLEQARARPAAAVLAAALHGVRGNIEAARIAIAAIRDLPEREQRRYISTILAALPKRQRATLIEELPVKQREDELWAIEKRSGTYQLGREAGREKGREEGRKAEKRRGLVELILTVLEVRNVAVDTASEAQIRAEEKLPTLERWAVAARKVERASELFEPPKRLKKSPPHARRR